LDPELLALYRLLEAAGCSLTAQQATQFESYLDLLKSWSQRTNLVSTKDQSRLVSRHFLESVAVLFSIEIPPGAAILDLGTGAGLPGVPMKIIRPDLKFVLLDSKRMKSLFLRKVVANLSLENVVVVCERAENMVEKYANAFNFIVSRAVAPLVELWEWGRPLLKTGGQLLAMKGGDLNDEIASLEEKYNTVQLHLCPFFKTLVQDDSKKIIVLRD
jgi:16S rRNA (guanine527-N7)-methyltransferase